MTIALLVFLALITIAPVKISQAATAISGASVT